MRSKEVVSLIAVEYQTVGVGNQRAVETLTPIKAEELSVYSSEFYRAAQSGLKPHKIFEVYTREYSGQQMLRHNNVDYTIIRTSYGKTHEKTRLTCQLVTGNE